MNMFGFYEPDANGTLIVGEFLVENTRKIADLYLLREDDILISFECVPKKCESHHQSYSDKKLVLVFNASMISVEIEKYMRDEFTAMLYLWGVIIRALRSWIITYKKIPTEELVPKEFLLNFWDAKEVNSLNPKYFDSLMVATNEDAYAVSVYLMYYIKSVQGELDIEYISEAIWSARRSNLKEQMPLQLSCV